MRRTTLVVEKPVEKQKIGTWSGPNLGLNVKSGYMIPYGKSSEDIEVFLRYSNVLKEKQLVELCGFSLYTMVKRAASLNETFAFTEFEATHPIVVSFPPDVIWLGRQKGAEVITEGIEDLLPPGELSLEPTEVSQIAATVGQLVRTNRKTYRFWQDIVHQRFKGTTYANLLMSYAYAAASRVKAKATTGIVPLIDLYTPGSISMAHKFNLAYVFRQNDLIESGAPSVPGYLYTLAMNSTMIKPDKWTSLHTRALRNVRTAVQQADPQGLDGVHVSVRGMERISTRRPRVAVLARFLDGLREICNDARLPLLWGRAGIAGLGGLDCGVDYASCQTNLNVGDVYSDGGPTEELPKFGKLLNSSAREIWDRDQVALALKTGELPDIGNVRNLPTDVELVSPHEYRVHFSKPYNLAGIRHLAEDWVRHTDGGEIQPGREYLQSFDGYTAWGSH